MSKIDVVRGAMVEAMKAKNKAGRNSLSMLFSALKNAEIDKRSLLTEGEENAIVRKEIKRCQEAFDAAPTGREGIRGEVASRIVVYKGFAPEDMSVEQIKGVTVGMLAEFGIKTPTLTDKGRIMKMLMPKMKGKADDKVVNETLAVTSK